MTARRIALLILSLTLVAFATTVTPAAAGTTTLSDLRAQLREVRLHLETARTTLATARLDLGAVQAALDAGGGAPLALVDTAVAPADTSTADAADTGALDPVAPDTAVVTLTDPAVSVMDLSATETTLSTLVAAFRPTLGARLLEDGVISEDEVAALAERVEKWRLIVGRERRAKAALEARIALRLQIAEWNRDGEWRPLIELAARRYDVSADGLYRLMMYESGGDRYAGSTFKGLYQYYSGTWRAGWNPWRELSIFNGWAQIRATAVAIHRGMGPGSWSSTYYRAF